MSDLNALQRDLVTANHIFAREGVTDALGHISVRHPDRPDRFFLSCSRSPELVQIDDIMEFDLDCNPIDQRGRPMYFERPIHGAIYQARPDVKSIVHNHANEVIPFGLDQAAAAGLRASGVRDRHSRAGLGQPHLLRRHRPSDHEYGAGKGFSRAGWVRIIAVLLRGHGCVVVGSKSQAGRPQRRLFQDQCQSGVANHADRRGRNLLSEGEIELTKKLVYSENAVTTHVGLLVDAMPG